MVGALLWAAPLSLCIAAGVLIASAPHFQQGPDTPSAGDTRAWNAIWAAVVLVGVGCLVGFLANAAWLVRALRRSRRPTALEWLRVLLHLLLGAGLAWWWFGR